MTHFKNLVVRGAIVAFATVGAFAVSAKDDLDELLDDLEGATSAETAKESAVKDEGPAEEKKDAADSGERGENAASTEKAEEPVAESKAVGKADEQEPAAEEETKSEEPAEPVAEAKADEGFAAEEKPAEATSTSLQTKPTEVVGGKSAASDAEILANIGETEKLRREAYDGQARREIEEARKCMQDEEFVEAARHYGLAAKLLNDRSASQEFRKECDRGVAEAIFQAALQERDLGNRERSLKLMEKAADLRHPKAGDLRDKWKKEDDPNENRTTYGDIKHRRNDKDYIDLRKTNNGHLRRARQLLATREIDKAIDECELVLITDPYNQDAIRLRGAILKKRALILGQEFDVTRDGMIADVDRAWRPVYAPNARQIEEVSSSTVTKALGEDPERALEQTIVKRMKEMRLPAISFKPPATIIDAVEFFRGASKDYDRPDIPLEQRGFNFVLKTPETLKASGPVQDEGSDDFSATASEDGAPAGQAGVPVIPMITASDITFYDALKLVCESVEYKFKVQGPIVMVMQKDMSTDEMITRSYPVVAAFLERMGSAASDMKEMKTAGFGGSSAKKDDGGENQERDWKEFFTLMGVQWPEGSSILYIKTIGKLRVKNTYDNLAELEKALTELNVDQKLIEIEARFVEVGQEDLNSLGFEWILNSDYTIGMDNWLGKAMNIGNGMFEGSKSVEQTLTGYTSTTTTSGGTTTQTLTPNYNTTIVESQTSGAKWIQDTMAGASRGIGVNAFGGSDSAYGNGNRYLSTKGNHISGADKSTNDQFMRVNAFIGNADLSMILHMLSQRSDTDLLSAPKVLTRPGEEAIMKVVTEYIYPTDYDVQLQSSSSSSGSSSASGGGQSAILAVVEPQSFTMREVGVILDVTPTLTDDGNLIDLKINAQVVDEPIWNDFGMRVPFTGNTSSGNIMDIGGIFSGLATALGTIGATLSEEDKDTMAKYVTGSAMAAVQNVSSASKDNMQWYNVPMEQPWFHVRSIDSNVSIYPGATIVMGGLITEERKAMDDKIPFLGDLPFVGRLFRSHAEQTKKRNLLIFVTTRLVDVRGREVSIVSNETSTHGEVKAAPEDGAAE